MGLTQDQFEFLRSGVTFQFDREFAPGATGLSVYGYWIIGQEPLAGEVAPTAIVKLAGKFRPTGGFPGAFEELLPKEPPP
jgi:hypothetical protein